MVAILRNVHRDQENVYNFHGSKYVGYNLAPSTLIYLPILVQKLIFLDDHSGHLEKNY